VIQVFAIRKSMKPASIVGAKIGVVCDTNTEERIVTTGGNRIVRIPFKTISTSYWGLKSIQTTEF
jgi:hypothetical protein